jgi:DNA polymerase
MLTITLATPDDFEGWRAAARQLVRDSVDPADVVWQVAGECGDLLAAAATPAEIPSVRPSTASLAFTVPKPFLELARRVVCHRDPERFALLHALLAGIRIHPELLDDAANPLVHLLRRLDQEVRRDVHKMRAFVRFREFPDETLDETRNARLDDRGQRFAAWFEPDHHIVALNAPFFVRRFTAMRWSILTPDACAHWDGDALTFSPGAVRADAPDGDPLEATWRTYYASIFNPARLKVKAMTAEMPKKYWKNLPETTLVPALIAGASARMTTMIDAGGASNNDAPGGLETLRNEASACTRCSLYASATQTVFGEGPADAALMFVGEQPGDQEDLAGRPFVGPAGQVFDGALAAAGIDRGRAYVTNAVKHFKFEPRGQRRLHMRPSPAETDVCRWWLDKERSAVAPRITVALGATAARAVTGRTVTISKERGRPQLLADGNELWITVHPSYLLRIEDKAAADAEYAQFVDDLRQIRARL